MCYSTTSPSQSVSLFTVRRVGVSPRTWTIGTCVTHYFPSFSTVVVFSPFQVQTTKRHAEHGTPQPARSRSKSRVVHRVPRSLSSTSPAHPPLRAPLTTSPARGGVAVGLPLQRKALVRRRRERGAAWRVGAAAHELALRGCRSTRLLAHFGLCLGRRRRLGRLRLAPRRLGRRRRLLRLAPQPTLLRLLPQPPLALGLLLRGLQDAEGCRIQRVAASGMRWGCRPSPARTAARRRSTPRSGQCSAPCSAGSATRRA